MMRDVKVILFIVLGVIVVIQAFTISTISNKLDTLQDKLNTVANDADRAAVAADKACKNIEQKDPWYGC